MCLSRFVWVRRGTRQQRQQKAWWLHGRKKGRPGVCFSFAVCSNGGAEGTRVSWKQDRPHFGTDVDVDVHGSMGLVYRGTLTTYGGRDKSNSAALSNNEDHQPPSAVQPLCSACLLSSSRSPKNIRFGRPRRTETEKGTYSTLTHNGCPLPRSLALQRRVGPRG